MNTKERFELAIAGYKDVSEQLRRWEAAQLLTGLSSTEAKRAAHQHLAAFDLFALHKAFHAMDREGSAEAIDIFEREIARFETATKELQRQLSHDGIPVDDRRNC